MKITKIHPDDSWFSEADDIIGVECSLVSKGIETETGFYAITVKYPNPIDRETTLVFYGVQYED